MQRVEGLDVAEPFLAAVSRGDSVAVDHDLVAVGWVVDMQSVQSRPAQHNKLVVLIGGGDHCAVDRDLHQHALTGFVVRERVGLILRGVVILDGGQCMAGLQHTDVASVLTYGLRQCQLPSE